MLTVLPFLVAAQLTSPVLVAEAAEAAVTRPASQEIRQAHQDIRPLPGGLDEVPVFNSNSPELVQNEGILLSTFPPDNMAVATAHLNHPLSGRFDIFAHHIARGLSHDDNRVLYLGILVHNPGSRAVNLDLLQAVTYLSQEAPFHDLPSYVANPLGRTFSGPGSRTANDMLRGLRQEQWSPTVRIPAGQTYLLANLPIPLRRLSVATNGSLQPNEVLLPPRQLPTVATSNGNETGNGANRSNTQAAITPVPVPVPINRPLPSNGRSLHIHARSDGDVYIASLAMYAPLNAEGQERVPTLAEWQRMLTQRGLVHPRDIAPTPPTAESFSRFFYGRVAGITQGSQWKAQLVDDVDSNTLAIPEPGQRLSYVINSVDHNTFGTGQIQSGTMLQRYSDTAYRSHGNYGVKYDLTLPLYNPTSETRTVTLAMQTPLQDEAANGYLRFLQPPGEQIFFRGTLRLTFLDDFRRFQTRYLHVVHRRGQAGAPLIQLRMPPGDRRSVDVQLVYPADATPPQVLTIHTLED
jgi:hypothetical protein